MRVSVTIVNSGTPLNYCHKEIHLRHSRSVSPSKTSKTTSSAEHLWRREEKKRRSFQKWKQPLTPFLKIFVFKFLRYKERHSACNLTERSNFLLVFFKDFIFFPNHQFQILLRPAVFLFLQVGFFSAGSDCKLGTMLLTKLTSASGICMLSLSSLRNNSHNAWSVVSNDGCNNLLCLVSLITFVVSPLFTDSFLFEESEFELGLLCGIGETSTLTENYL